MVDLLAVFYYAAAGIITFWQFLRTMMVLYTDIYSCAMPETIAPETIPSSEMVLYPVNSACVVLGTIITKAFTSNQMVLHLAILAWATPRTIAIQQIFGTVMASGGLPLVVSHQEPSHSYRFPERFWFLTDLL